MPKTNKGKNTSALYNSKQSLDAASGTAPHPSFFFYSPVPNRKSEEEWTDNKKGFP